jgi:chromosome segregation ATPase
MSLLDDYQNLDETPGKSSGGDDPGATRKKRAELERQIVIAESDLKKLLREKQDLEEQQRRLKKEEERLRVDRDILDKRLKKIQDSQMLLEEEIKNLKKKLKVLR